MVKNGLDMIKPKKPAAPGPDLSAPGPLERGAMPPASQDPEPDGDEADDASGYEDQGAKLISDIEAAGDKHGLDPQTTRSFAADVFSAMADCLRGGAGQDAGGEEDSITPEQKDVRDVMGGGRYGR